MASSTPPPGSGSPSEEGASSSTSARSPSPCGACKIQRRKCTQECVFAPFFPPDQQNKFTNVHDVFGARNVARLLHKLPPQHREAAVVSLAFEAQCRLRDPVYGCMSSIFVLQQRLRQLHEDINAAEEELALFSPSDAAEDARGGGTGLHPLLLNPVGESAGTFTYQQLHRHQKMMDTELQGTAAAAQLLTLDYQDVRGSMGGDTGKSSMLVQSRAPTEAPFILRGVSQGRCQERVDRSLRVATAARSHQQEL